MPRIEANQNKVKLLQDLSSGENKSKYMVCNHVLKRIPRFSCPLGRKDRFKLMGAQTDIWNLGYIFLYFLGIHQNNNNKQLCFVSYKKRRKILQSTRSKK